MTEIVVTTVFNVSIVATREKVVLIYVLTSIDEEKLC